MTQPGQPGYPGPQPAKAETKMADLSNPEQGDNAAKADPAAAEPAAVPATRIAELEAELVKLRSAAITGLKVLLRVGPPHESMTYGGITVTDQPTEVPAVHVPALTEAAARAGVDLIQEG